MNNRMSARWRQIASIGREPWEVEKLEAAHAQGRLPFTERTLLVGVCHGCGRDLALTRAESMRHNCSTEPHKHLLRCAGCDRRGNTAYLDERPKPSRDFSDPWEPGRDSDGIDWSDFRNNAPDAPRPTRTTA